MEFNGTTISDKAISDKNLLKPEVWELIVEDPPTGVEEWLGRYGKSCKDVREDKSLCIVMRNIAREQTPRRSFHVFSIMLVIYLTSVLIVSHGSRAYHAKKKMTERKDFVTEQLNLALMLVDLKTYTEYKGSKRWDCFKVA